MSRNDARETRGRMSEPYPPLTLGSFSRPILGCGLYAPSRLGGLTSRSPRCFGGQVARRRLGARQNLCLDRSETLWRPKFEDCGVYPSRSFDGSRKMPEHTRKIDETIGASRTFNQLSTHKL